MAKDSGSVALAKIEDLESASSATSISQWEDVVADPNRLDWVLHVSRYYRDIFDKTYYDCYLISGYDDVCYLIDFDVLRPYLEVNSLREFDTYVLDSLFYNSTRKYALPLGAFLELLDYIADLTRQSNRFSSDVADGDPEGLLKKIAELVGIENATDFEMDETVAAISNHLDQRALTLTRLLNVLTDPRFVGVVSSYDEEDSTKFNEIITTFPRPRKGLRTKVDQRDAINIAIVAKNAREARRTKGNTETSSGDNIGYILVSRTNVVTRFPQMISENHDDDTKYLMELCNILGLDADEHLLEPDIIMGLYPVMHPRRVINIELLGVYENKDLTFARARALRNNFWKISEYIEGKAKSLKLRRTGRFQDTALSQILNSEQTIVENLFKEVAEQVLSSRPGGLLHLEQNRATLQSIENALHKQGGAEMSRKDEIRQKSTGLLELLGEVLTALGGVPGFDYIVQTQRKDESRPFEELQVVQTPRHGSEPLLFGEKYNRLTTEYEEANHYYALRWPVTSMVEDFVSGLMDLIVPLASKEVQGIDKSAVLALSSIDEESYIWQEGVVFTTNSESFGAPLAAFWSKGKEGRDGLDLQEISTSIQRLSYSLSQSGDRGEPDNLLIQQYRINTLYGDFVFDIVPVEGERFRYLTVISHYNLGQQIVKLYKSTGMMFIVPTKLAATISNALTDFEYPIQ
jgi:hypothetical protein